MVKKLVSKSRVANKSEDYSLKALQKSKVKVSEDYYQNVLF